MMPNANKSLVSKLYQDLELSPDDAEEISFRLSGFLRRLVEGVPSDRDLHIIELAILLDKPPRGPMAGGYLLRRAA